MNRDEFRQLTGKQILLMDGATGTELQKRNMPKNVCPEAWVLENPHKLQEIQQSYIDAGASVILTCSFGGNRVKLKEFGLDDQVERINLALARISREAAGGRCLVAGDLAPTGRFVEPFGETPFEEMVDTYKEQARGLLAGGVDLFLIETMIDLQEARAAFLAVREICELPVIVSVTYDSGGKTLTGSDPLSVLITLQSLGADAIGANCSTGPKDMLQVVKQISPFAKVPLMVKPNAGLPKLVDGQTVFDMDPADFGGYAPDFAAAGVNLIGGCCGTTPEHIKCLAANIKGLQPVSKSGLPALALASPRKTVFFGGNHPFTLIGERINPTGKKLLSEELREGKLTQVRRLAAEQADNGADILDVNVGMPGINEKETMLAAVRLLSNVTDCPLCLDSASPEVLEAALRLYPGRALINSISGEEKKLRWLLPLARKYGSVFILLPLDDKGVPETAGERCAIIQRIIDESQALGINKDQILVDGLVMSVSSNQNAAAETLKVIRWCTEVAGCATLAGLSNVSFGLPERGYINGAFLAMGIANGLCMAIANPSSEIIGYIKAACDVLTGRDKNSAAYIAKYSGAGSKQDRETEKKSSLSTVERISRCVLEGDRENVTELLRTALGEGLAPGKIVDAYLIPAITEVGRLYEEGRYFLPQLIQSAETMQTAFGFLAPHLARTAGWDTSQAPIAVLATVKGDIHDIGKNIVALMLRNNGFNVHDLGKNVEAADIIGAAKKHQARLIGLSALLTTTMVEMKTVADLIKEEKMDVKLMVGGAVVTESYAREIGADGYAKDAYEAVKLAKRLAGEG